MTLRPWLLGMVFICCSRAYRCTACNPSAGSAATIQQCEADRDEGEVWVGLDPTETSTPGVLHPASTYAEGLCLDVNDGVERSEVTLKQCDPSRTAQQYFKFVHPARHAIEPLRDETNNAIYLVHAASGLCITVAHNEDRELEPVNLFDCAPKENVLWNVTAQVSGGYRLMTRLPSRRCLSVCGPNSPSPPPPGPPSGPVVVTINGSNVADQFHGVWALSANGAARQLWEYSEPTRAQILDLLFSPGVGTRWQGLKVEIGGDVESSYGSMSSFKHTSNVSEVSFSRGVQWWLMTEAKKRNPNIPLYCLTWGLPYWVGPGGVLSPSGVQYHIDYLTGAKEKYGLEFEYIGIWNEAPWTKDYILDLREALDKNGFGATGIVAADGSPDIIDAAGKDPQLADAISAFGVHAHVLTAEPVAQRLGKPYFNTENDLVDGVLPQWRGTETPGLSWPLAFLLNYINAKGTATMLCPGIHSWNQMLGRHMHGPAYFNDPWSGYYQLAAPFFTQSHVTQFTEIGWHFVGNASGQTTCATGTPCLTYASFSDQTRTNFTFVAVNTGFRAENVTLRLAGEFEGLCGYNLQRWDSTEQKYFARVSDLAIPCDGSEQLRVSVLPGSITTISSLTTSASWATFSIPQRTRFSLPFQSVWGIQSIDEPCRMLSPVYGAFEIAETMTRSGSLGKVCRQAVPQDPGANAWTHRKNSWPTALFPGGSNAANIAVNVTAKFDRGVNDFSVVSLCGRTPIWAPALCMPSGFTLGVCLSVMWNTSAEDMGGLSWRLTEADNQYHQTVGSRGCSDFRVLANGTLRSSGPISEEWFSLGLVFSDNRVSARIGTEQVSLSNTTLISGVVSLGTSWNPAFFDGLSIATAPNHRQPPTTSFLFDVLPGRTLATVNGWAGMILNLTQYPPTAPPLAAVALGRFRAPGNAQQHQLAIARASDGAWVIPPSSGLVVDLASCTTDALGFCYSQSLPKAVSLPTNDSYYIVSSESFSGDSLIEMIFPATGADYGSYRSGDTLMTYGQPSGGGAAPMAALPSLVSGKVIRNVTAQWQTQTEGSNTDTAFGPVNLLLAATVP